ncbi:hypothetical protein [Haladaptatus sp. DFWS20]|uniref:hypothetical protein n=1 Tax=Haladaptatus sp. DFWS20 TaxID=3403467 RepID=UPI003EBA6703
MFFYADDYIIKKIIENGRISAQFSQLNRVDLVLRNWGKIKTRENLPILPIFLSELSIISGLQANIFYIFFPGYLFIWGSYFILFRKIVTQGKLAFLLAGLGSIAPNIPVNYTMNVTSVANGIIILSTFLLYRAFENREKSSRPIHELIVLCLFLCILFFWYPPNFGLVLGLVVVLLFISLMIKNRLYVSLLLPIVVGGLIAMQIFEIPLGSYVFYIRTSTVRLLELKLSLPTSGQSSPLPTAISPSYYSLIPLVFMIPLGGYGGLLALKKAVLTLRGRDSDSTAVIAVAWGIAILFVALLYLSSGHSFLIGRPFQLSVPVIMIGVAFAIDRISYRYKRVTLILIFALVITFSSSFHLQATDIRNDIQTYGPGADASGEWINTYASGLLLSDVGSGAPSVGSGYVKIIHPDTYHDLQAVFYAERYGQYEKYISSNNISGTILSERMYRDGIFALGLPQQSINQSALQKRINRSNSVYSNGHYWYLNE